MESFQKTCLFVATVILIISLIFLGFIIRNSLTNAEFPPIKNLCPDYWDVDYKEVSGVQKLSCVNRMKHNNVNTCSNQDDSTCNEYYAINWAERAGGSELKEDLLCEKYKWAKSKGLSWDGITNNSKACKY
jgi:hypothetical protein